MRVLLLNVTHPSIGSRIPDDHLPPLGLLAIGGPLLDAGHVVQLLDADLAPRPLPALVADALAFCPDVVLLGHSGSTSGHPVIVEVTRALKAARPQLVVVLGGVFPSYHFEEILTDEPSVDVVVRGEGEATAVALLAALERGTPLRTVRGLAFRERGVVQSTPPAETIRELDAYRIGWELIDFRRYSYWGGKRAVVVQFSRGCPHHCSYCGQRGFWTKWRHRDPVRFAKELAWLHRVHGVELVNFADENPTSNRKAWRAFLEALIAEDVPLELVGSTRADDIVRDADLLPLYRRAGWTRFLLGLESTDEATLAQVKKGGTRAKDRQAVQLLRQHGIVSMATWAVGFEDETDADFWRGLRQLLTYDPDQVQLLYVTPHRWTPLFREARERRVVQEDRRLWDYKHQVLENRHLPPWRVLLWVKVTEAVLQLRPKALWRTFLQPEARLRHAMRWYSQMGRRVWPHEVLGFVLRERRTAAGPTVEAFWGAPQDDRQDALARPRKARTAA